MVEFVAIHKVYKDEVHYLLVPLTWETKAEGPFELRISRMPGEKSPKTNKDLSDKMSTAVFCM